MNMKTITEEELKALTGMELESLFRLVEAERARRFREQWLKDCQEAEKE